MNSDYIKEELGLLLKDELILDYKITENLSDEIRYGKNEIKQIIITTLEKNILEILIDNSFCYKIKSFNSININKDEMNENKLFEDLSNLINNYSSNFRNKFNDILKVKLLKLQNENDSEEY